MPELVGSIDHCNTATKAIRLLLAPDWEGHKGKNLVAWALNKNKKPETNNKNRARN
ncbi:hypothetical protein EMIT0P228_190080 [Pseudomonas brassicacearum]